MKISEKKSNKFITEADAPGAMMIYKKKSKKEEKALVDFFAAVKAKDVKLQKEIEKKYFSK